MGTFLALDLFMFFVFFEVVLVPMYFLIANWGHGRRDYAAMKFFLYTLAGSAFLLVGMLAAGVPARPRRQRRHLRPRHAGQGPGRQRRHGAAGCSSPSPSPSP